MSTYNFQGILKPEQIFELSPEVINLLISENIIMRLSFCDDEEALIEPSSQIDGYFRFNNYTYVLSDSFFEEVYLQLKELAEINDSVDNIMGSIINIANQHLLKEEKIKFLKTEYSKQLNNANDRFYSQFLEAKGNFSISSEWAKIIRDTFFGSEITNELKLYLSDQEVHLDGFNYGLVEWSEEGEELHDLLFGWQECYITSEILKKILVEIESLETEFIDLDNEKGEGSKLELSALEIACFIYYMLKGNDEIISKEFNSLNKELFFKKYGDKFSRHFKNIQINYNKLISTEGFRICTAREKNINNIIPLLKGDAKKIALNDLKIIDLLW